MHERAPDVTPPEGPETDPADTIAGAIVEPSPDPLASFAVDANELISRIHAGEGQDLNALIRRSLDQRAA